MLTLSSLILGKIFVTADNVHIDKLSATAGNVSQLLEGSFLLRTSIRSFSTKGAVKVEAVGKTTADLEKKEVEQRRKYDMV